ELNLTDGDDEADEDDDDDLMLDDEETVRSEAARLTAQLEASQRRMAALEARRAALLRRLESGRQPRRGDNPPR
ncbi:MAG TPA: hypothetical protein VI854_00150, partial [Acidimicrobiia bacterium]|nr:hypothetical protein [Acidimicrobiia bacterium]